MLSIAAPLWLIGLMVIPVVWWLHRLGDPDEANPVSAVFLFYTLAEETGSGQTRPRANPIWILRAALLSLLVLALAHFSLLWHPQRQITVWFDNSLSMQTHEQGRPRIAIAALRLGAALDEAEPAKVRIRMLSDHGKHFDVSALSAESRSVAIERWAGSQQPGESRIPLSVVTETENWLVTDGADDRINAWMDDAFFSRGIMIGSETENNAVTAISARHALLQTTMYHGSVRVHNLGAEDSKRSLIVHADDQVIFTEDIEIIPGDSTYRNFRIPSIATTVVASLFPEDALTRDETLKISLDDLRPVVVDFDTRCGSNLRAALNAHRGLELGAGTMQETTLTVQCGASPEPSETALILVHTGSDYQSLTGPVQWHQPADGLTGMALDHLWLQVNPNPARSPSARTLLSSPDMVLSLIDRHAGVLDVFLDLESASIVERPEYPLLINALVELALERQLLDPVVRATRKPVESRIARQLEADIIASPVVLVQARTDMTPYLLVLAAFLLLTDILLGVRQGGLPGAELEQR